MSINPTSRGYNKALVLGVVLARAPLTRNELIDATGLSKATVSRAVEELRADGFIIDGGRDEVTGRGRRSTYLDVPGSAGHVVGVSFGAQRTGVLVVDLRGREVEHVVVPTVGHEEVGAAAEWLVRLMTEAGVSAQGPMRQIVVAVPARVRAGVEIFGPAEAMKAFEGSALQQALAGLVAAPVLLDSDANAALRGVLAEDAGVGNAALFSASSILSFACCTEHQIVQGRTPTFGDLGILYSGVGEETLDGLLSTSGLHRFARDRGLDLERVEDLWLDPPDGTARAEVLEAFITAIVTAVVAVAATLDPESVYFVGRLQPLVEEVLPAVRHRLSESLPTAPVLRTPTQVLGLSVARGAVDECLDIVRGRLGETVLEAGRQGPAEQNGPAF